MDSTYTFLLVAACGLGLLCLLGLAVGLMVVSGVMGGGVRLFGRRASPEPRPAVRRERPDLRAKAQSVDFDAAVTRYSAEDDPLGPPGAPRAQGAPPPDLGAAPPSAPLRSRRSRSGRGYSDDEVFGGILDEDGDGYPNL